MKIRSLSLTFALKFKWLTWNFLDFFQLLPNQDWKHSTHYLPFHQCFFLLLKASIPSLCGVTTNLVIQIKNLTVISTVSILQLPNSKFQSLDYLLNPSSLYSHYYCPSSSFHHFLPRSVTTSNHNVPSTIDHVLFVIWGLPL